MSKYKPLLNNISNTNTNEKTHKKQQLEISKLCCLPILMPHNQYKKSLTMIQEFEDLLNSTQRMQIYQMIHLEKLLKNLENDTSKEKEISFEEKVSKYDKNGMLGKIKKFQNLQQNKDPLALFEIMDFVDPMLKMVLQMFMNNNNSKGENGSPMDISSLLPMLFGMGDMAGLGNLANMAAGMGGFGGLGNLANMVGMGDNTDMMSSLFSNLMNK